MYSIDEIKMRWHCDEAHYVGDFGYGLKTIPKRFAVIRQGRRWGLLYGEEIISDYRWLEVNVSARMDYKHLMVRGENGWGLMDSQGRLIIEPVYVSLQPLLMPHYGEPIVLLAFRQMPDCEEPRMGMIDINGCIIAPCIYPFTGIEDNDFDYWDGDGIGDSSDYGHRVLNAFSIAEDPDTFDYKYGLLNTIDNVRHGEPWQLFPPKWDQCEYLTMAFIDSAPRKYSFGSPYAKDSNTLFFLRVCEGGKWGIVDTAGRVVTPCLWDEVHDDGYLRRGNETHYIDLWSGILCDEPPKWEIVWTFRLPPIDGEKTWRTTMVYYRMPGSC